MPPHTADIAKEDAMITGRSPATCTARRKDGSPCSLSALPSESVCFAHSARFREGKVKGGHHSARAARLDAMLPARLRPLLDDLLTLFRGTYAGTIPADRARACANVAGAIVKVLTAGELEERMRELEAGAARPPTIAPTKRQSS
jgi:hypothetical protein